MKLKKLISTFALLTLCLSFVLPLRAMDMARVETRTDLAVSTFGVTGQGVIVALLDRGIDWKNNDFRNDDGTTRIKYIFDLTDNTGASAPGNIYGRGTIYTEAQINAALAGGPQLATRDAVGHGTTTAGIAAGNGRNLASRKYRGIAPNASIIAVKVVSEGAPAHDAEPAEAPFNDATAYPVAIDFVRDKAAELGMPAVMLLNLGSINGPTDGTSSLARKIDATVGPGKPGLVFVTGAGDDGGMPNHAGGVVAQNGTASIQIQKGNSSSLFFDLWYGGNDRFDVSLQTPSGNFGPYASPATNNDQAFVQNSTFTYYHQGANLVFYGSNNGKREIFLILTGPAGTYTVQLQGQTVSNGRFDATINPSNIGQTPAQSNRFLNFVVPGSIWDGATAFNNICPNSYVIRNDWTDIDGVPRSITGQGNPGELWTGSSVGPTFDGRLGIDISAPGNSVFTTYNPTSYFATFRFNLIQDGGGFYGRANAVSAAAPQVTGIIALMLQANPQLDAAQVKSILQTTARTDSFTGATPNSTWGYGKVNAYYAVLRSLSPSAAPASITGHVTTSDGQVLSGVTVRLDGAQTATTITDDNGRYSFTNINADEFYTLTPVLANYTFNPQNRSFSLVSNRTDESFTGYADSAQTANPLDTAEFFVRQQYLDFLGREPDQGGLDYWAGQIRLCNGNADCINSRRNSVAAAFFIEAEFQATGFFVYRFYRASYGSQPTYAQFTSDRTKIKAGDSMESSREAFAEQWVKRPEFLSAYPQSLTAADFVNRLYDTAQIQSAEMREQQIEAMLNAGKPRAQVLRDLIETQEFLQAEYNRAFVLMQYFGYLRRDADSGGFSFWLDVLNNRVPGNYRSMVCAFITSAEYQHRFSSVITRNNNECGQ